MDIYYVKDENKEEVEKIFNDAAAKGIFKGIGQKIHFKKPEFVGEPTQYSYLEGGSLVSQKTEAAFVQNLYKNGFHVELRYDNLIKRNYIVK